MELIVFGSVIFTILVAMLALRHEPRFHEREQTWVSAATRLGLPYADRCISGEYDGVDLEVRQDGSIDSAKGFYLVGKASLDAPAIPPDLKIYRETLVEKMGKRLGSEDIELGIPRLDRDLIVKTAHADAVREWASDADVARGLEELVALSGSLKIESDEIAVQVFFPEINEDQLVDLIETLASAARALAGRAHQDGAW